MDSTVKALIEDLQKVKHSILQTDHLVFVVYPYIEEKKLVFTILKKLKESITSLINIILKYDSHYKRIKLQKDTNGNLRTFIEKCSPRYNISRNDLRNIFEILNLYKRHTESSMEFKKQEKYVILSENKPPKTVDINQIKEFLETIKQISQKTEKMLNSVI